MSANNPISPADKRHICERPGCGRAFVQVRCTGRYCSAACAKIVNNQKTNERRKQLLAAAIKPTIACVICGEQFSPRETRSKYCSPECYGVAKKSYRVKHDAYRVDRWTLSFDPFSIADTALRDWEGRLPDAAMGF